MLIALMTILFLGGGSGSNLMAFISEVNKEVKVTVVDEDRREAALDTLKAMKQHLKEQGKAKDAVFKRLKQVLQDHSVSGDSVEAIWAEHFSSTHDANRKLADLRFELREQLTREEWEAVFAEEVSR